MRILIGTPIPTFNCPTRRSGLFPYTWNTGGYNYYSGQDNGLKVSINDPYQSMMARTDYAANAGDQPSDQSSGGDGDSLTGGC